MKKERILIQENYDKRLDYDFSCSLSKLKETFTQEKLNEVGITLSSEVVRDILSGTGETEAKVRETLNQHLLSGYQLPAVKRNNEALAEKLLKDFLQMAAKAKSTMSSFKFIPVECFFVDGAGIIELNEQGRAILKEAGNLYIDKPEQIEVYNAALEVIKAAEKLDTLAKKYRCNAFGHPQVLYLAGNKLDIVPDIVADCHPDGCWMRAR